MRLTDTSIIKKTKPVVIYNTLWMGVIADAVIVDGSNNMDYSNDYFMVYPYVENNVKCIRKDIAIFFNDGASFELSEIINRYKKCGNLFDIAKPMVDYINNYVEFYGCFERYKFTYATIVLKTHLDATWYVQHSKEYDAYIKESNKRMQ